MCRSTKSDARERQENQVENNLGRRLAMLVGLRSSLLSLKQRSILARVARLDVSSPASDICFPREFGTRLDNDITIGSQTLRHVMA